VPTSITLKVLHDVIQAAMGKFDYHRWEFVSAVLAPLTGAASRS
jgi:hypothetical protein